MDLTQEGRPGMIAGRISENRARIPEKEADPYAKFTQDDLGAYGDYVK